MVNVNIGICCVAEDDDDDDVDDDEDEERISDDISSVEFTINTSNLRDPKQVSTLLQK